ncbi:MAG: hypothetical protein ACLTR6_10660 [Clostridium fessum]
MKSAKVTVVLGELKKTDLVGRGALRHQPGHPAGRTVCGGDLTRRRSRSGARSSWLTTAAKGKLVGHHREQTERRRRQRSTGEDHEAVL